MKFFLFTQILLTIFLANIYFLPQKVLANGEFLVQSGHNSGQVPNHCGFISKTVRFTIESLDSIEYVELYGRGDNVLNFVMNGVSLGPTGNIPSSCEDRQNMGNFERVYNVSASAKNNLKTGENTLVAIAGNGYDPAELDFTFRIKLVSKPWLTITNATSYVKTGFKSIKIPSTNINIPEVGIVNSLSTLSNSLVFKSNGNFPTSQISPTGYDSNYNHIFTALDLGEKYDLLKSKLVNDGSLDNIFLYSETLNGEFSKSLDLQKSSYYLISTEKNLNIAKDSYCDIKGIFFIEGDLNIQMNLNEVNDNSACIYFAKGSITFELANSSIPNSSINLVNGMFVSVSNITFKNNTTNPKSPFGVIGSILGKNLVIQKTLGGGNLTKPSLVIKYSPKYKILFQELFEEKNYSLRQQIN